MPHDRETDKANIDLDEPIAVIDIGATSVRMAIAQISNGEIQILEKLSQAVSLGKDSFIHGRIKADTVEDCVKVLKIYSQKLEEYLIEPGDVRIVATSAVREAKNRLAFQDRVFIATGFEIEPFDEAELHRATYLSIEPVIDAAEKLIQQDRLVCEVGGGSTEVLALNGKDVCYSQTFRLGALRLRKELEQSGTPVEQSREIMKTQIDQVVRQFQSQIPLADYSFIVLGSDVRLVGQEIDPDWKEGLLKVGIGPFAEFTDMVLQMTPDEIYQKYHLSYPEAETLGPALLTYLEFARETGRKELFVARANLRDGMLKEIAGSEVWTISFQNQIARFALNLGRKYHFDEAHCVHVANLSQQLFRQLQAFHELSPRHKVILFVAGLLHEIGLFIDNRSFHKHSMYLIRNSEFFGLGRREIVLTSLVARYHRRAHPQSNHDLYGQLSRRDRVAVSKLAAMLRVAKALDESRTQRIKEFQSSTNDEFVSIKVVGQADISLESVALKSGSKLFQEVFGRQIILSLQ